MKRKAGVHLIQSLFLIAALGLAGVAIGPLRKAANRRADMIKDRLIGQLETDLGVELHYDSISPALLSAVTVRNVEVLFPQGEFTARRLRIFVNPIGRLREITRDPASWITRLTVAEGHLKLALSGTDEKSGSTSGSDELWNLLEGKTIVLRDISAEISEKTIGDIIAEDLGLRLIGSEGLVRYQVDASLKNRADESSLDLLRSVGNIDARMSSSGSFISATRDVNGRMDLEDTASDYIRLKPISVDFTYSGGKLDMRRIGDARPLDLSLRYDAGTLAMTGEFIDLTLSEIAEPGLQRQSWSPWFESVVDGRFSLSLSPETGRAEYDVGVELSLREGAGIPWPWTVDLIARGTDETANVDGLSVVLPWGRADYTGLLGLNEIAPKGDLVFRLEDDLLGYPVNASFGVDTIEGVIRADPYSVNAGDIEFHDFRFLAVQENRRFSTSLLAIPAQPDGIAERRIILDALLDLERAPVIYGFATMEGFEASDVSRLMNIDFLAGLAPVRDALFNLKGSFEANADSWLVYVDEALVLSKENPENLIVARGKANSESWSIDSLKSEWDGFSVDGRAYGAYDRDGGIAEGRLIVENELFPFSASWKDQGTVSIYGPPGVEVVLGQPSDVGRNLSIEAAGLDFPYRDGRVAMTLSARGRVGLENWYLNIGRSRFAYEGAGEGSNRSLEINGQVGPYAVDLPRLRFIDPSGVLVGRGLFERSAGIGDFAGQISFGSGDQETYEAIFSRRSGFWDAHIQAEAGRLSRFGGTGTGGRFNLDVKLSGTPEDPIMSLDIDTQDGIIDYRSFALSAKGSLESGKLRVHDLLLLRDGVSVERGLILADLDKGVFRGTAELSATYNQVPVSSGFSLAVDFQEPIPLFDLGSISEASYSGTLGTRPLLWNKNPHFPGFTFQFSKDDEELLIQTPEKGVFDLKYRFADGRLDVKSGSPMPMLVNGGGYISDDFIDLSFAQVDIDPVLINYVMIRDPILLQYHVVFQEGRFVGNLDIKGPTASPDLYGKLRAVDLKVDTPYTYADIRPASTDILFEGNRITFDRIEVPVGNGIAYGGGYFVLDAWKISDFDMKYGCLSTQTGGGVPVYYPLLGVYLDGLATGNIHMTGSNKGYHLEADLVFPQLKASLRSPTVPVVQRKPGKRPTPVSLDFRISTGNNCTFYLPNEQFKIVKAIAEPNQTLFLSYDNDPKNLSLSGSLPFKSGDIFYFDRDFQITEGAMIFNESLGDFDPVMQLRAETRVWDEENEEVTVALVYDAPVKSDFNPQIETVPSRSDIEILALFGQAVIPYGEAGETDVSSVLLATGGMFAQVGLVQPFEDVLREGLNLDMVTIRTDIIENTLVESMNRGSDSTASNSVSGLGRFLDNTSLFAGKYIGNALFVSGSVSARYFEGQRLSSVFGGLEFETSVSLEMTTPFFNIAWSYTPDPASAQNFIADNEISLKWQFSY